MAKRSDKTTVYLWNGLGTARELFGTFPKSYYAEQTVSFLRTDFVGDFILVANGEERVRPSLRVNVCSGCLRHYTYVEIVEAAAASRTALQEGENVLLCDCGKRFIIDYGFDASKKLRPTL